MKRWAVLIATACGLTALGALYGTGQIEAVERYASEMFEKKPRPPQAAAANAPAVTVVAATPRMLEETIEVTGTITAKEQILVAPEISNQRILKVHVEEGDRVRKGQVLAKLVSVNLEAQIAQNKAAVQRASAAIAQARSSIEQAKAAADEAEAALVRARTLSRSGHTSRSVYDQRVAAARTARAQLAAAGDGLHVAEAEKAQAEAQSRELLWRLENTQVRAPADGLVSRRNARIGAIASASGDPMFIIIQNGDVELNAEATARDLAKIATGQSVDVIGPAGILAQGRVRLISTEIDPATRLGQVRISLPDKTAFRIGAFARGRITTARNTGLAIPLSAVMYDAEQTYVLVVENGKAHRREIETGLRTDGFIQVRMGLEAGANVVAKAGTFLRDGDAVRPVTAGAPAQSRLN